ncbi:Malolactic regulator [Lacticaseibacillus rhamnosus]|nr:Malolactic regulator [Lacticaseibacillus rhamnosus GG]AZZ23963.1 Malolactic regulator [Lacticaseibacillus rhamnosus]PTV05505.1 Malolactic regulator [Lacticaseibacillus rhamnosus]QFG49859.1 Malolactic regulator [Lacticaseibacillus rhamnosus]RXU48271.1 Malolactic regulator [Lacticaseibacillus rhamnosus]
MAGLVVLFISRSPVQKSACRDIRRNGQEKRLEACGEHSIRGN